MCYHISLAAGAEELARRFGRKTDLVRKFRPAYHVCAFSHLPYPVVTRDEQIQYFRWGLIPYWIGKAAQTVTIRNQTVVACAETIFENASFRVPIRRRRCLIPVSGFFGWHHGQAQKTPYYVTVKDRPVIALAGVFDCWIDRDSDEVVMTYSVITTEANPMMRHVNNRDCRMPVILHDGDEERWLHPELSDGQIAALLKPYPEQMMVCEPVQPDFMRKVSGDSGILMPA